MLRRKWFCLTLALLLALSVDRVRSQDASLYLGSEPASLFSGGVQYLAMSRDARIKNPDPFIAGPDLAGPAFGDTNYEFQSGVRAFLALRTSGVRLEGIYSKYGVWNYAATGELSTALSFDDGISGVWAGSNYIDSTTGFQSLHAAASPDFGGDADETEGLGPAGTFPGDASPIYNIFSRSSLESFELNLLTDDPTSAFQFGFGYRNLQLDESAGVSVTGTLRAIDDVAANNGISHAGLIGAGGLTFLSGTANGFEDENGNISGLADELALFTGAKTANNLNGIQFACQEQIMYWRGWTIDGIVKMGIYHNRVTGSVVEQYAGTDPGLGGDTSTYGRTFSSSKSSVAFAGSLGLQSTLPFSEHWSLLSGYEMLLIHGVALAPEQYGALRGASFASRSYDVDTHGQIIAHGVNVGLQFTY